MPGDDDDDDDDNDDNDDYDDDGADDENEGISKNRPFSFTNMRLIVNIYCCWFLFGAQRYLFQGPTL